MVQCFTELHGIYKRMAVDVIPVMFVKIAAGKKKACYLSAVLPEPDILKVSAHAHEKRPSEDVRGLKTGCSQLNHLLSLFD